MSTLCVKPTSSGTGDGSDWTNALGASFTPVRGNTYLFADGNYGAKTWSAATSGTTEIIIRKATVAAHGPEGGWVDTLGDGVATWSAWTISSGYWTFDGVSRTSATGGHGFALSRSDTDNVTLLTISGAQTEISFSFVEGAGDATFTNRVGFAYAVGGVSSVSFASCYIHDLFGLPFYFLDADTILIEGSTIARNHSTAGWHTEGFQGRNTDNVIIRNNIWQEIEGTAVIVSGSGASATWKIHGNVFDQCNCGNGTIADNDPSGSTTDWDIFHNTISNAVANSNSGFNFVAGTVSDVIARNNLFYNVQDDAVVTFGNCDHDYNYFSLCSFQLGFTSSAHESPVSAGEATITENPINADFTLVDRLESYPGIASAYSPDASGNARGVGGHYDIGAFQSIDIMADSLTLTQTANTDPVAEVWYERNVGTGSFAHVVRKHSGPYPSQPVNGYERPAAWGKNNVWVYIFRDEGQDDETFIADSLS